MTITCYDPSAERRGVRRVRCVFAAAEGVCGGRGRRPGEVPLMAYAVKEIFYTLQGEGVHTGRAAVFCRFAGCNLWSGHEQDRATAVCQFCDTEFVGTDGDGGGKFATRRGAGGGGCGEVAGNADAARAQVCGVHRAASRCCSWTPR